MILSFYEHKYVLVSHVPTRFFSSSINYIVEKNIFTLMEMLSHLFESFIIVVTKMCGLPSYFNNLMHFLFIFENLIDYLWR